MTKLYGEDKIAFPHVIPTNTLSGVTYTFNNVNGGVKSIGSFGLTTNTFYGGRCHVMGFIKELGFWGCQDKDHRERLLGFYLDDPNTVTDLGKKLIEKVFPNMEIIYAKFEDLPKTTKDVERLKEAQERAKKEGIAPQVINGAAVDTLESLIKAVKFERDQANKPTETEPKTVKKVRI